jgi:hypothetical protein
MPKGYGARVFASKAKKALHFVGRHRDGIECRWSRSSAFPFDNGLGFVRRSLRYDIHSQWRNPGSAILNGTEWFSIASLKFTLHTDKDGISPAVLLCSSA